MTVALKMTERADQLHHDKAPAHCTALVQEFFGKASQHPGLSAPLHPRFGSLRILAFLKAKITAEKWRFMNATVTQYTSSLNGVSLPIDEPHGRVTVYRCTVRSPLTGCQVTSRPRNRFSRYSKWLDTFRTDLVHISLKITV